MEYKFQVYNITDKLNPKSPLIPLNIDKVIYIVLHHAQALKCTWKDINLWHEQNGWSCAGYNEFIDKNGDVYIMRGDNIGAQCLNFNSKSYGICLEGDFNIEQLLEDSPQFQSLIYRLIYNKARFTMFQNIKGHFELYNTECPGKNFPLNLIHSKFNDNMNLSNSIEKLQRLGIIKSPNYWLKYATKDQVCDGEFVGYLLNNIANRL
jgi:hypothetical protein